MNARLKELAMGLLDQMAAKVENRENVPGMMLIGREADPAIFPLPESAGDILESGLKKDIFFGVMRERCQSPDVEVFGFCSEAWLGELTDAGVELMKNDNAAYKAKINKGLETLLREGYITRDQVLQVSVQNREDVVIASRKFEMPFKWVGEVTLSGTKQTGYMGRTKMWGDLRKENLA